MKYEDARHMVERSSWYQEIAERNFIAAKLIELSRERFKEELQAVMERHARQQVHIDALKRFCRAIA